MQRKHIFRTCAVAVLTLGCALMLSACDSKKPAPTASTEVDDPNASTYNVTLNPNGGAFSGGSLETMTIQVKEGKTIDFATYMPEYEGNTLYGWYQADGAPWPGARKVTGDLSLKAKWSVTEEVAVYKLVLTIDGETIPLEYDNGVYQFTHVSSIYGGYAQRSGKYTVYEDDLLAAMKTDDGKTQRVLLKAESNYIDATGTIYAEFYNDGEFELYYDYTNGGERTKYCMNTGYWSYEGYTAPFENTPIIEDESGMGGASAHTDWDASLIGGESGGTPEDPGAAEAEIATLPGAVIYTANATASETMKANFCDNGVLAIFMTTYNTNVDAKYLWSNTEEDGFSITYNGGKENLAADNGDGTYGFSDGFGNSYTVSLTDLTAAVAEPVQVCTAPATVSKTMFVFFYDNHTFSIMFDLTSYGMAGQYSVVAAGQWRYSEESGLELVGTNKALVLTDAGDGTLQFTMDDNTYAVVLADLVAGISR